tara:strand:+ start:2049 stop:2798 length:750 start_codon:yes stop_codon:yes gene_type:complete
VKIFYDHIYGNTTKYDIIYGLALSEVDKDEEDKALDLGWTPMDAFFYKTNKQLWIQARTTRIDLNKFKIKKKHKQYFKNPIIGRFFQNMNPWEKECNVIFKKYCEHKGYDDHSTELTDKGYGDKDYFVYFHNEKIIGYTELTRYKESVVAGEFAWDYEDPKLSLGTFAQNFECMSYKDMKYKYYYSSYAYEKACEYKSHYNGFQWWTGRHWSDDKYWFRELLKKDSEVNTLKDLYYRHKSYYEEISYNE